MEGKSLSHYRIIRKLGGGGMGEVYLAEDTKLGRQVAIKLLAAELTRSPENVERFRIEAKAAASLNHPNIATVYSVEEVEGRMFIVMEYVEGQSLGKVIPSGGMALKEFFRLAIPLADALAKAHEKGVMHRDVKPGNVIVTPESVPKVLDFGLARIQRPAEKAADLAEPTRSLELTRKGTVIGTVAYMSPEQAEGKPVDSRTDIFSFGVVIYEMLTGRRPFEGDTSARLMSSILKDEPPSVTSLKPEIPREVARVINRCLGKDVRQRYQSMLDVLHALEETKTEMDSATVAVQLAAAQRKRSPLAMILVAAVAVAAVTAAVFFYLKTRRSGAEPLGTPEVVRLTTQPGLEDEASWSPDGRSIVYTSDEGGRLGIWMRQVTGERGLPIGSPNADEAEPAWSPDGTQVAFVSSRNRGGRFGIVLGGSRTISFYLHGQNGDLFVMPALGGSAKKVADDAYDPSWSPDGKSLAFRSNRDGDWRIWTVNLDDGRAAPVQGIVPRAFLPAWSPDGRWLAYISQSNLFVIAAAGGTPVALTKDSGAIAFRPNWWRDGRSIIYSSSRSGPVNLWRVPFRENPPGPARPPERITTGVGEDLNATVSPDGTITYTTVHSAADIYRFDLASRQLSRVTSETSVEDYPRISPDGGRMLFMSNRSGRSELWVMDLKSKELTQLSQGGGDQGIWSPDGRTVVYRGRGHLQALTLPGGQAKPLTSVAINYPAMSPDGRYVSAHGSEGGRSHFYRVSLNDGAATKIASFEGNLGTSSWAADGKSIFYQLDRPGRRDIWAVDVSSGQSRQVTDGAPEDSHPDVSPDARSVLFVRNHTDLYVAPAKGGAPKLLYASKGRNQWIDNPSWTPDGRGVVFSLAEKTGDLFVLRFGGRKP